MCQVFASALIGIFIAAIIMFATSITDRQHGMKNCVLSGKSAADCEWIYKDYLTQKGQSHE